MATIDDNQEKALRAIFHKETKPAATTTDSKPAAAPAAPKASEKNR